MRILILTSNRQGYASRCLPALSDSSLEIVAIVLAGGGGRLRWRKVRRATRKVLRIGVLGALNGVRLRRWYADKEAEDVEQVAARYGIPVVRTRSVNTAETEEAFQTLDVDLGISLGNGYIGKRVFKVPRNGMVNLHTELLPDYQGAQSVIWPIYYGRDRTGFTIHQIDEHIDTGDVLLRREYKIEFQPTLRRTVAWALDKARREAPSALRFVCENYAELRHASLPQGRHRPHTTPTWRQFRKMVQNHKAMYATRSCGGFLAAGN